MTGKKTGVELVAEERQKQIDKGYDEQHDSQHEVKEFILATEAYLGSVIKSSLIWGKTSGSCIEDLAKAGALIAAAIDRVQREEN